jgi:hypothetical protein
VREGGPLRGVKVRLLRVDEMFGSTVVPGVVTPRPVRDAGPAKNPAWPAVVLPGSGGASGL